MAFSRGEQANSDIFCLENRFTIDLQNTVRDTEYEFAHDHALQIDDVGHLMRRFQNLAGELHIADAERTAATDPAKPAEEKTDELLHRI